MKQALLDEIDALKSQFHQQIGILKTEQDILKVKSHFLGRQGHLTALMKKMGGLTTEDRPDIGKSANLLKNEIEQMCQHQLSSLRVTATQAKLEHENVDITLPGRKMATASIHPVTQVLRNILNIFSEMGFETYEGPEIETNYYNFEALNFLKDHPARDMQDTFYVDKNHLLRTHTSPIQIHVMKNRKPPLKVVGPGAAYRRDSDVSHTPMFHQVEGFMVGDKVQFSDLKGVLTHFVQKLFGNKTKVRLRPSFFPFTEPSAEIDISCVMCRGKGCRVCQQSGWLEVLGCGMIDPGVFQAVGYNPKQVTGFAFGMGIERMTMLKYGINDIRLFFENDVRFLGQF
jgi:phenylalanyl-tRNA synthetase alpha chain